MPNITIKPIELKVNCVHQIQKYLTKEFLLTIGNDQLERYISTQ
jgi:uncharacterized protein (DUF2164 family)